MINRFRDHAANERTFLAWIRTAIAIMAFGFLLEKFDIFIAYIHHTSVDSTRLMASAVFEYIGLGLMLVSVAIITGSTLRFFHYERAIDSDADHPYHPKWANAGLAGTMLCLAGILFVYLVYQFFRA